MNLLENIEDKILEAEDGKWSTEEVKSASIEFEKLYRDFTEQDNSIKSIIDKKVYQNNFNCIIILRKSQASYQS
jgi:hypothetical protein